MLREPKNLMVKQTGNRAEEKNPQDWLTWIATTRIWDQTRENLEDLY